MLPVLVKLWTDAWHAGTKAAQQLAPGGSVEAQELADLLSGLGPKWATQIAETTLKILAKALVAGTSISDLLSDAGRAAQIAVTEVTRVMMTVATTIYTRSNVSLVEWVVYSSNPCASCLENQAAGPWPLGTPFPSGDIAPPGHIRCECGLVPAKHGVLIG